MSLNGETLEYSAKWIDLCAKELAMRMPHVMKAQRVAYAKSLYERANKLGPIDAANMFSRLCLQEASRKTSH